MTLVVRYELWNIGTEKVVVLLWEELWGMGQAAAAAAAAEWRREERRWSSTTVAGGAPADTVDPPVIPASLTV